MFSVFSLKSCLLQTTVTKLFLSSEFEKLDDVEGFNLLIIIILTCCPVETVRSVESSPKVWLPNSSSSWSLCSEGGLSWGWPDGGPGLCTSGTVKNHKTHAHMHEQRGRHIMENEGWLYFTVATSVKICCYDYFACFYLWRWAGWFTVIGFLAVTKKK